jgi:hypothetical protein
MSAYVGKTVSINLTQDSLTIPAFLDWLLT